MASHVNTQVQVYHYLIHHPAGYVLQYSKVEAYEFGLLPPGEEIPGTNDQTGPSLELLLVGVMLLLLPIFIYLAYRYGKKIGKGENTTPGSKPEASNIKRKGSSINPDDNRDLTTQTRTVESRALIPYEGNQSPLLLPSDSNCEVSKKTGEECPEESSIGLESKGLPRLECKEAIESQSTRPGSSSSEQDCLNINGSESSMMNLNNDNKVAVPKFEVNMVRQYSVEEKTTDMVNALNEEKLKLHSNEEQVSKVEIKYHLSFETKDGNLHKIEKQEVKTIYAKGCQEPENNAIMLKNAYENYQQGDPLNQNQCSFLNTGMSSECKSPSTALVPVGMIQRNIQPVSCSETQICLVPTTATSDKVTESYVDTTKTKKVKEIETEKVSEAKTHNFQIDDIPHETGKFAKIFKNVEEIGEGGFGRVYRVVHKLDGKIYAVKKAKLKLDSFEDLQQKSKVFREVFAMTDLHHPNIVRYSTCWVEIENSKSKKTQPKVKSQMKVIEESQSAVTEESESQVSESESSHTKTSSCGFEWDLGDNQDGKTQESAEKKHLEIVARKMENTIMKSLTMTYNDEKSLEESSPSHLSQTGNTEYFGGVNLYLYIQMEYCAGQNLRDYLDTPKKEYSDKKSLGMFRKILEGVYAIHKRGIFHRDLKPANIFLDGNENIKIGDFGLASLGNNEESKETPELKHFDRSSDKSYSKTVGTPMYASPEQAGGGRYNHKTDIYSLGFILAEMLSVLSTHHERYQLFKLLRDSHELPAQFKTKYSKESELILKMTSFSPDERPTAEHLIAELDKLL